MNYFEQANEKYNNKEYEDAISLYEKSLENKENKDESATQYNLGICHMKLKDYNKAISLFKSALNLKIHSNYFFNLGYSYTMLKEYKKAYIYFNAAWALDNDDAACEKAINIIINKLEIHKRV